MCIHTYISINIYIYMSICTHTHIYLIVIYIYIHIYIYIYTVVGIHKNTFTTRVEPGIPLAIHWGCPLSPRSGACGRVAQLRRPGATGLQPMAPWPHCWIVFISWKILSTSYENGRNIGLATISGTPWKSEFRNREIFKRSFR